MSNTKDIEYAINWNEVDNQIRANNEMAVWEPETENKSLAYPHFDLAPYIYKRKKNKCTFSKIVATVLLTAAFFTAMFLALDSGIKRCERNGYSFEQCIR